MILHYIAFIVIHWICDFVLQDGDIGSDRESGYKLQHVGYYTVTFTIMTLLYGVLMNFDFISTLYFIIVCTVCHGIVDYALIPVLYKFKKEMNLKMLGLAWALDQSIHISFTMIMLAYFII